MSHTWWVFFPFYKNICILLWDKIYLSCLSCESSFEILCIIFQQIKRYYFSFISTKNRRGKNYLKRKASGTSSY